MPMAMNPFSKKAPLEEVTGTHQQSALAKGKNNEEKKKKPMKPSSESLGHPPSLVCPCCLPHKGHIKQTYLSSVKDWHLTWMCPCRTGCLLP